MSTFPGIKLVLADESSPLGIVNVDANTDSGIVVPPPTPRVRGEAELPFTYQPSFSLTKIVPILGAADLSLTMSLVVRDFNVPGEAELPFTLGMNCSGSVINDDRVENPEFSPSSGTAPLSVTITCATVGATTYYTDDGSDPRTSATRKVYTTAVSVSSAVVLAAYAVKVGLVDSEIVQASYGDSASQALPVSFDPPSGTPVGGGLMLVLASQSPGVPIYYTLMPDQIGQPDVLYTGPIAISTSKVVRAQARGGGYTDSIMTTASYDLANNSAVLSYVDQTTDKVGPWGQFTPNGSPDFHFAVHVNRAAAYTISRMFIAIVQVANIVSITNSGGKSLLTLNRSHGYSNTVQNYVDILTTPGVSGIVGNRVAVHSMPATNQILLNTLHTGTLSGTGTLILGTDYTHYANVRGDQIWDTSNIISPSAPPWYPLGVFVGLTQLNSAYNASFGPYTGEVRFDVYGQIVSTPSSLFRMYVFLTDSTVYRITASLA